jgi:hypothetical protein
MAKAPIPQKQGTFGTAAVNHISPANFVETAPTALNIVLSFEEALKLHLSLGQALARLNSYDRTTTAGRAAAISLGLNPEKSRIFVTESKLKKRPEPEA